MADSILRTRSLTRRFGDLTAVDGIDLDVPEGSVYAFLGPNGAGKTTTIRMALGLLRPDAGTICVVGRPMPAERGAILARVGALVESPALYDHLTGRENLEVNRVMRGLAPGRTDPTLDQVGLARAADRRVSGYSLGMRQRLGLALALLGRPRLLVLDEPTNGLDPAGIEEIRRLVRRLPDAGTTVFLSSHLLAEVERTATHVGIVRRGALRFQGTIDELRRRTGDLARLEVRVDRPSAAVEALHAMDREASVVGPGELHVRGSADADAAEVADLLVAAGIRVYRLGRVHPSLERSFFRLVDPEERR